MTNETQDDDLDQMWSETGGTTLEAKKRGPETPQESFDDFEVIEVKPTDIPTGMHKKRDGAVSHSNLNDVDDDDMQDVPTRHRGFTSVEYGPYIFPALKKQLRMEIATRLRDFAKSGKIQQVNLDAINFICGVNIKDPEFDLFNTKKTDKRRNSESLTRPHTWDFCLVFAKGDKEEPVHYDEVMEKNEETGEEKIYPEHEVNQFDDWLCKLFQVIKQVENANLNGAYFTDGDSIEDSDYFYVLIGANEASLRDRADRQNYDLKLDVRKAIEQGRKKGFALAVKTNVVPGSTLDKGEKAVELWENMYAQYLPGRDSLYQRYARDEDWYENASEEERKDSPSTIFSTKDRQRLIYEALISDRANLGGELPLYMMTYDLNHPLTGFFPLHQEHRLENFKDTWLNDYSLSKLVWVPVEEIRNYFGEPIGFYFAFLQHYTIWLIAPAIVGTCVFVAQNVSGEVGVDAIGIPLVLLCFWTVAVTDFWKREESVHRIMWGMTKYADKEAKRPQFQGDWEVSDITGKQEEVQKSGTYYKKVAQSCLSVILFISMVITSVGFLMNYRAEKGSEDVATAAWVGIVNAVMIFVFDNVYYYLRIVLNDYENHRTQRGFENSDILKSFVFRFTNTFLSLFWIAFIQPEIAPASMYQIDGRDMTSSEKNEEVMASLQIQLICLFLTAITLQNITESFMWPIWMWYVNYGKDKDPRWVEKNNPDNMNTYEKQRDLAPYPDTLEDMSELVIQFGYVTLFVVAFPLAPFLAFISNVVEMRVDGWKLVDGSQRPVPVGSVGLGMWTVILDVFSTIAVLTNVALYTFRSDRVASLMDKEPDAMEPGDLWTFFIGVCVLLFGTTITLKMAIPNIPAEVERHVNRQKEIENIIVLGAVVDSDDEDFEEIGMEESFANPKHVYLRTAAGDPVMGVEHWSTFSEWERKNAMLAISSADHDPEMSRKSMANVKIDFKN